MEILSISEGGPFYRLAAKSGLFRSPKLLVILILCVTWLPLVIICGLEGTLYSGPLSFIADVSMQARLLIAIPFLTLIKLYIDFRVNAVLQVVSDRFLDDADKEKFFRKTIPSAKNWTRSLLSEIILLLLVIFLTVNMVMNTTITSLKSETGSWMANMINGKNELTLAGYWALFISIPVFQFLFLRWLWRYMVWIILLYRISRMNLKLVPSHPDGTGGLAIILLAQRNFNRIFITLGFVLSGELITQLINNPGIYSNIRSEIIGYIVICIILVLFPILFFSAKLLKAKREGLGKMSKLGVSLNRRFENEWINDQPFDASKPEPSVNPSMVHDYAEVYKTVQQLRPVPVTFRELITLAIVLFLPFTPILFIYYSVAEILKEIFKLIV